MNRGQVAIRGAATSSAPDLAGTGTNPFRDGRDPHGSVIEYPADGVIGLHQKDRRLDPKGLSEPVQVRDADDGLAVQPLGYPHGDQPRGPGQVGAAHPPMAGY